MPFFVIVVPFTVLIVTMLADLESMRVFTVLSTSFLSFIPLINPISTIAIIRPYRDALLSMFATTFGGFIPELDSYFKKSTVDVYSAGVASASLRTVASSAAA